MRRDAILLAREDVPRGGDKVLALYFPPDADGEESGDGELLLRVYFRRGKQITLQAAGLEDVRGQAADFAFI